MNWSDNYFQIDNIYCIPSVHGSIDFGQRVRSAYFDVKPDCIAVELPDSLMSPILQGIKRLPYLSVISFLDTFDEDKNTSTYHYIPIQPCDSIIEACRLAVENGIELYFVDRDMTGIPIPTSHNPDTYYINKIGLRNYCNNYLKYLKPSELGSVHYLREQEMAYRVQKMSTAYKKVLFVYGLYHHPRIVEFIQNPVEQLIPNTVVRKDIQIFHLDESSYNKVLGTMPFQNYLYEIGRKGLTSFHIGLELPPEDTHKDTESKQIEEFHQKIRHTAHRIRNMETQDTQVDQYDNLHELMIQSRRLYFREWDDKASSGKLSIALKFARNYALVNEYLVPSPYQLVIAAKNTLNDDFAWELIRVLNFYPFMENEDDLRLFSNALKAPDHNRKITYKPYLPTEPWIIGKIPIKKRPREGRSGDWNKVWNMGYTLISYPAEDIIIENYFHYLRKKGRAILEKEHTRTVEFQNSILDGLDIKETIRNLHLGKLYVKEQTQIKGDVGTVVVIFDEKDPENRYSFTMTWYAEHQNESDLVLYSTPPGEKLVGPGISRAEYGGLLSVFPPRGIREVWSDHRFDRAKSKAERLLLAGIHYSEKRYIIYVAPNPPRRYLYSISERYGHHVIYIPLTQLSETMIKKVRFFHFLSDRRLRSIASRYIRL